METLTEYDRLLNNLMFAELEKALDEMPIQRIEAILDNLAYNSITEEINLLVYTFLWTKIMKHETATYHLIASRIMGLTLNHINKGEEVGLYHGLKAAELDPENVDILEYLLYFNHIPEKVLDDTTAISFAKKIIERNPNSLAAKMTLGKLN